MRHSVKKFAASSTVAALLVGLSAATAAAGPSAPPAARAAHDTRLVGSTATTVVVYFTRGEHFAKVTRPAPDGASLDVALRELMAGPTPAELRRGLRTSLPRRTLLHGTSVADGVATIDVSSELARGTAVAVRARLTQLVYTATRLPGIRAVRIAIDGVVVPELGGLEFEPPITRDALAPMPSGGPPPQRAPSPASVLIRQIQERLIALSYLPAGAADGIAGPQTTHAILAFQGWEKLPRDGRATPALKTSLQRANRPLPARGPARRIDVSLARQVALTISRGRVVRTIHVSTGKPASPTPPGRFSIFRKELRSWSVPFQVWLPYASYFNRGIAFHEAPDVPAYPASAGCVRIPVSDSAYVYGFARMGTTVIVRRS